MERKASLLGAPKEAAGCTILDAGWLNRKSQRTGDKRAMTTDKLLRAVFVCAALIALSAPAMATPITGTLQLGGNMTVGSTSYNFCATAGPCAAAPGNWNVPGNGTGDLGNPYANDPNGGLITNLNNVNAPVGTLLPGNGILFLTFAAAPGFTSDIEFYLRELDAGVGGTADCLAAAAPGQTCTPTGSAVTFLNGGSNNSSGTITMSGRARRISTNEFDNLQGIITLQFNTPFQSVESTLAAQGTITTTYSVSFTASNTTTAPVPEPMSSVLLSSSLLVLGFLHRRRRT
jgi:hypothetical protein